MNLPTIHALRKAGFKLKIEHYRRVLWPTELPGYGQVDYSLTHKVTTKDCEAVGLHMWPVTRKAKKAREFGFIHPKGGSTSIWMNGQDGKVHCASAQCNNRDRFNRRLALTICLGRLVKAGAIPAKLPAVA